MSQMPPPPGSPPPGGPPPVPPPGYGTPPPGAPPPGGSAQGWSPQGPVSPEGGGNKGPLIIVLVVVLVAAVAGAAFLLLGDDDGDDPADTVRSLISAMSSQDCGRVLDLTTSSYWSTNFDSSDRQAALDDCEREAQAREAGESPALDVELQEIVDTTEDGDQATVDALVTVTGLGPEPTTENFRFRLVRQDGDWKVDDFDSTGSEGPGPEGPGPEEPGPEEPGPEAPGPEAPGPEAPGPEAPGPEAPGPDSQHGPGDPPPPPSGNPQHDSWADECFAGDMDACNDLYVNTPIGSAHEEYGGTCGGRRPVPADLGGVIDPCPVGI